MSAIRNIYYKLYIYIYTILFIALSTILITRHEFFGEEIKYWILAKESNTIPQLFCNINQNNNFSYLWSSILFFISHFITNNIESLKIINILFSSINAFLILKFAPFNKVIKVLLVFSYFLFYEYSIISTSYILGILFIIIFCILYKNKFKNILTISIILALMSLVNIFSLLFSIFFISILLYDLIKNHDGKIKKIHKAILTISVIIIILVIMFACLQTVNLTRNDIWPKDSSSYNLSQNIFTKLKNLPDLILKAYFPIPELKLNFWNTNLLINHFSNSSIIFKIIFALTFLTLSIILISKKIKIFFIINILVIFCLNLFFNLDNYSNAGYIFILFLAYLWSSINEEKKEFYLIKYRKTILKKFLLTILSISVIASSISFYFDYRYPFSQIKNTAEHIKENFHEDDLAIIGINKSSTKAISGYLDKYFYYPEEREDLSNILDSKHNISLESMITNIEEIKIDNPNKNMIIIKDKTSILSSLFTNELLLLHGFIPLEKFTDPIINEESYELFILDKNINSKIIKKLNIKSFKDYWINITNCDFVLNDNKILIKPETNDPYFESNFIIPKINKNKKLVLKIGIEVNEYSEFTIYYKRSGNEYSENDKSVQILKKGLNSVIVQIDNPENIKNIRIDPVNTKIDCYIESFDFYELNK